MYVICSKLNHVPLTKCAESPSMEHIAKRKQLKKEAAKRLRIPISALGWVNGTLVLLATKAPVDGVPAVPKPERYRAPEVVRVYTHWTPPPTSRFPDYRYN